MGTRALERSWVFVGGLAVLTAGYAALVAASFDAPDRLRLAHDAAGWTGAVIGLVGTVAATLTFSRGDHLRRVWGLLAASSALLLLATGLRSYWTHVAPDRSFLESPLLPFRMAVVVAANAASTYALVLLALTYRRSGLRPPPSWRARFLALATGAAGLALSLPQLVGDVGHLASGGGQTLSAITSIASTLGDLATILLVVPILRVAYMLRGGRLAWVWWAMALSGAIWLVYDARAWIALVLPGSPAHALELLRVTRALGLATVGLAGALQRVALEPVALDAPAAGTLSGGV